MGMVGVADTAPENPSRSQSAVAPMIGRLARWLPNAMLLIIPVLPGSVQNTSANNQFVSPFASRALD
jgi:hypothetical protein